MSEQEQKSEQKRENRKWDKPQIGGLYRKVTSTGKTYLSGFISIPDQFGIPQKATRIVIYPNDYKSEDKHPDMRIYLDIPTEESKKIAAEKREAENKAKATTNTEVEEEIL